MMRERHEATQPWNDPGQAFRSDAETVALEHKISYLIILMIYDQLAVKQAFAIIRICFQVNRLVTCRFSGLVI